MGLLSRAHNVICAPRREWTVIAAEDARIGTLYTGYVAIVAGIGLAAELAGGLAAGGSLGPALGTALSGYVLALANVAILALVASRLAPAFGGVDDRVQGFKLAAFASTPVWLGGVFLLLPGIGEPLAWISSLYGLYLYYLGIPELMRVAPRRRPGYFALVVVVALVAAAALALLLGLAIGQARMTLIHR